MGFDVFACIHIISGKLLLVKVTRKEKASSASLRKTIGWS